jgi:hypothetical protein
MIVGGDLRRFPYCTVLLFLLRLFAQEASVSLEKEKRLSRSALARRRRQVCVRSEFVRLREVIHTCSNEYVAEAALISLGGPVAKIVAVAAARRGLSLGRFVAELACDFERHTGTCIWARAEQAMRGADQPVLVGLYVILAQGLLRENLRAASEDGASAGEAHGDASEPPRIAAA